MKKQYLWAAPRQIKLAARLHTRPPKNTWVAYFDNHGQLFVAKADNWWEEENRQYPGTTFRPCIYVVGGAMYKGMLRHAYIPAIKQTWGYAQLSLLHAELLEQNAEIKSGIRIGAGGVKMQEGFYEQYCEC